MVELFPVREGCGFFAFLRHKGQPNVETTPI
jgi:hypothetical protein